MFAGDSVQRGFPSLPPPEREAGVHSQILLTAVPPCFYGRLQRPLLERNCSCLLNAPCFRSGQACTIHRPVPHRIQAVDALMQPALPLLACVSRQRWVRLLLLDLTIMEIHAVACGSRIFISRRQRPSRERKRLRAPSTTRVHSSLPGFALRPRPAPDGSRKREEFLVESSQPPVQSIRFFGFSKVQGEFPNRNDCSFASEA